MTSEAEWQKRAEAAEARLAAARQRAMSWFTMTEDEAAQLTPADYGGSILWTLDHGSSEGGGHD